MRLKHSWDTTPDNWESLGTPPADTVIDLHIALKPHRENALIDVLNEVSNPMHPKYGAYLSKEQAAELVAPHPDTLKLVYSWLEYHRVLSSSVSVTNDGSSLTLTGVSVSQANDLLGASYQLYMHTKTNETIVRTVGYSLPTALHGHVQTVAPTTYFSSPLTQWQTPRKRSGGTAAGLAKSPSGELSSRDEVRAVTPAFLRWLYSTFSYVPVSTNRNALGITGFKGEYPSPTDLDIFMRTYRSDGINAGYTVELVNGGIYDPSNPGIEANVDLQFTEGMTYPTPQIFYSTGRSRNNDVYFAWLTYVLKQRKIPQTITTSYGNYEKLYPREYAVRVCFLFAQLGARGVSVLFSSGDHGVGEGDCKAKDGTVRFTPLFPATCPFVTAVGGTKEYMPEVASGYSGGGFSDYFLRHPYQYQAVSTYFRGLGNQHYDLYNPLGRGIPDIAAQSEGIRILYKGKVIILDGTSCSTPIVASIISLLNDRLLSDGKPPLGFLNPWLYSRGRVGLNDIKSGENPGCGTNGFPAIAGWDPVTGFGTPDFEHLMYIVDLTDPSEIQTRQTD
ncbi:subtilisin-like protein [Lactarius psammicola]|nr:subtilisin-like protein [Lactarius psammicola]